MRVRYPTLHSSLIVHHTVPFLVVLHQAGLTRDGDRMHHCGDYLPVCDDARGVTEGWPLTVATFQALRRREHDTDAILRHWVVNSW